MNLTTNFTLEEMLSSGTATRLGIKEQFTPTQQIIYNLKSLSENILQPLREAIGHSLHVNSGYRCIALNKAVGGKMLSQHTTGCAADLEDFQAGNAWLYHKIIELKLPFDQLIWEFGDEVNPAWVHVSYNPAGKQRGQCLTISK